MSQSKGFGLEVRTYEGKSLVGYYSYSPEHLAMQLEQDTFLMLHQYVRGANVLLVRISDISSVKQLGEE